MQRCTLRCDNVAGTSFSQRSEKNLLATLYNIVFTLCVCWAVGAGSSHTKDFKNAYGIGPCLHGTQDEVGTTKHN